MSAKVASYWKRKTSDETFHSEFPWGGPRSFKFSAEQKEFIKIVLKQVIDMDNQLTIHEMTSIVCNVTDLDITTSMIYGILQEWNFTPKVAFPVQRDKYTVKNIMYYTEFIKWFAQLPSYQNVKVLDECHFDSRSKYLYKRLILILIKSIRTTI